MLLDANEIFVWFRHSPWFRDASIAPLVTVARPAPHHLYWPDLDVDLAVESPTSPDRYPLVGRVRPNSAPQRSVSRDTALAEKRKGSATRRSR